MPITICCTPIKELFHDSIKGWRVLSCSPNNCNSALKLNNYHNFTISGSNLSSLQIGSEANLIIEPDEKSKYPASYLLVGFGGISATSEGVTVDPRFEYEILSRYMTKEQAENVNKAYPNFVSMILNKQEAEINHRHIFNVGEKRLASYIDKVKNDCNTILFYPVALSFGVNSGEQIKELSTHFTSPGEFEYSYNNNPYYVYIDLLGYSFDKADSLALKYKPELVDSKLRCEYGCLDILHLNEQEGDTRLNVKILANEAKHLVPEAKQHMVEAIKDSERIHYDEDTKTASIEATYQDELLIADHIRDRVNSKMGYMEYPMNWQNFRSVDGFECTDEQMEILKIVGEGGRIGVLTGSAGCVDCDTEFFTGHGWKRIADYQEGDRVLQYNQDGSAELVAPERYIKIPCESLWHFETNKSINQTVCEEHRILYTWGKEDNKIFETNVLKLKGKSENNVNWNGKFIVNFKRSGKGIPLTEAQIRLMVCVMAEGHFNKNNSSNWVIIRLKKLRKRERIVKLLEAANIPYEYRYSELEDVHIYKFYAPERRKVYGDHWWDVSAEQAKIIEDEVTNWDGGIIKSRVSKQEKPIFRTTEKQSADFMQYVFCINGWQATIKNSSSMGTKPVYGVSTSHTKYGSLCFDNRPEKKKTVFEKVPTTDGFKYCFTVPSGMLVLRRKDCIFITGNCGKTSSVKALIRMLEANGNSYTLLAPTGIAAKRLRESTGRDASTIHMFLAKDGIAGQYVIIDEFSICSVSLMANLLRKIGSEPNLIFVCDEAQLASISCGNLVQDLIDSEIVPRANLTKVFRYGSTGLATMATDTRFGTLEHLHDKFPDFTYIPINSDPVAQVLEQYDKLIEKGYKKDDILILTPYNTGTKGTYVINNEIQSKYNANDYTPVYYERLKMGKIRFKIGDRVVNTHNNYHMPALDYDENGDEIIGEMQCMNGDFGTVRGWFEEDGKHGLNIEFDNGIARVMGTDLTNILLGTSVTVHRIQGAQAKAVIVLVDKEHKKLLSRNILYVALSRAQETMCLIADEGVLGEALEVQENLERDTNLGDMLKEGIG